MLTVILTWVNGEGNDDLFVQAGGLNSATEEHLTWLLRRLVKGDELLIRIIESTATSRVRSLTMLSGAQNARQEKAWLRETAKKYGYQLEGVNLSPHSGTPE